MCVVHFHTNHYIIVDISFLTSMVLHFKRKELFNCPPHLVYTGPYRLIHVQHPNSFQVVVQVVFRHTPTTIEHFVGIVLEGWQCHKVICMSSFQLLRFDIYFQANRQGRGGGPLTTIGGEELVM